MKNDNSYLKEKIKLREDNLPNKNRIKVLDCYAGQGIIWDKIKRNKNNIDIVHIEIDRKKAKPGYLIGNNIKYIKSMDIEKFDIIDLDSYGLPFMQLEELFNRQYNGIIFVTCIQSIIGALPRRMLYKIGYTKQMVDKIPTLFFTKGLDKILNWLYIMGINEIKGYFFDRKNYIMIDKRRDKNANNI